MARGFMVMGEQGKRDHHPLPLPPSSAPTPSPHLLLTDSPHSKCASTWRRALFTATVLLSGASTDPLLSPLHLPLSSAPPCLPQVLYLVDPVDEYLMQNLTDYDDKKFQNATKEDLKIGTKKEQKREKEVKEAFKDLTAWWKKRLGSDVEGVKVREGSRVYGLEVRMSAVAKEGAEESKRV